MSDKINPWFTQVGSVDWDHALTGFFPHNSEDACIIWPKRMQYGSKRLTLGIMNSESPDRTLQDGNHAVEWNESWQKRNETLETVPKIRRAVFSAAGATASIAGTITLNIQLGDIFVITDSTLSNTTKPYQITVTNLGSYEMMGKSVVLKVYLMEGIQLKFGNNIIIDTSAGSDFEPGTYCITFANTDITNTGENSAPIQVISLWKIPGYTNV